jgi:hypothetical protein
MYLENATGEEIEDIEYSDDRTEAIVSFREPTICECIDIDITLLYMYLCVSVC